MQSCSDVYESLMREFRESDAPVGAVSNISLNGSEKNQKSICITHISNSIMMMEKKAPAFRGVYSIFTEKRKTIDLQNRYSFESKRTPNTDCGMLSNLTCCYVVSVGVNGKAAVVRVLISIGKNIQWFLHDILFIKGHS